MRSRLKLLSIPLVITMLAWGFNFVSVKLVYRELAPEALALSRFLLMWGLLVIWCRVRGESLKPLPGDGWRLLAVGFVTMGLYMVLFLTGIHNTSAGEGAIVLATVPLITPLLAALIGQEVFSATALGGALVAFGGVVCVALGAGAPGPLSAPVELWLGDAVILASAFVWAFGIVMTRPLLTRYSPAQVLTMSMPGALPILLPFGLRATLDANWSHLSATAWANFTQIVVLSGVVAFIGFNAGLRQVGASAATLYQFFVPALAAFFSYAILGQTLAPLQWVGFAVVLVGVAWGSIARQRANAALLAESPAVQAES